MNKMNQKGGFDPLLLVALVLVFGVGAFVLNRISAEDSQASTETGSASQLAEELPTDLSDIKSVNEIRNLIGTQDDVSGIQGIELETNDNALVYVVHLADGQVFVFDARTGESVTLLDDDDDEIEQDDSIPADYVVTVSIQDAIATAKAELPGSKVEKVELEVEDGSVVYSVRFTDDSRVDVNAETGAVIDLRSKADDDFDDDGEDNNVDSDDDNDGIEDDEDSDDDNDGIDDDEDDDDDNDGVSDDDDDDDDEDDEDDDENDEE